MTERPAPIAATRHTIMLVTIFLGVSALIALQVGRQINAPPSTGHVNHVPLYLSAIAFEWGLFYAAWRGLHQVGTPVDRVLGQPLFSAGGWARAAGLGLVAWPLILLVAIGVKLLLARAGLQVDAANTRTIVALGPHGALEIVLWILVSISAGICEEFVFRGYLMRQFAAWWGWVPALFASAVVFGLGHAYQGIGPVLTITVHGVSFGLLALLTRRLGPGMVAHALEDIVSGLRGA